MKRFKSLRAFFINEVIYIIVIFADIYVHLKRGFNQKKINKDQEIAANDQLTKEYCQFNKKNLESVDIDGDKVILMDCFPVPMWMAANAVLVNCLSKKFNAKVHSFGE